MQALQALETAYDPWPLRRRRTEELRERYTFAVQILRLYRAVLDVQERAFHAARTDAPEAPEIPDYVATRVLPHVVDATVEAGPALLAQKTIDRYSRPDLPGMVRDWLEGATQWPVETYLARAAAGPILEAIGIGGLFDSPAGEGKVTVDDRHCPACGGLPQLSYIAVSGEALVTGPRYLVCSRCGHNWVFTRMVCAGCGETSAQRLPIYAEGERFPHVRIDGCESCRRYLLTFDLRKDTRAVPIVDEMAALPLDLYAQGQGLTKITPNLVGN